MLDFLASYVSLPVRGNGKLNVDLGLGGVDFWDSLIDRHFLRVALESQKTKPNHQLLIFVFFRCPKSFKQTLNLTKWCQINKLIDLKT